MATVSKQFFRGSASLTETTLYSVPSSTSSVVTNIIITNSGDLDGSVTIIANGVPLMQDVELFSKGSISWDLKQVFEELDYISALATTTDIKIHISGVEIS